MKKYYWIILICILAFGFYLRAYHIDYPVIGYHNWKETHYLTEARNFVEDGFFANGFFIPEYDYPTMTENVNGVHADTFPTISIIVGVAFKLFGEHLYLARIINIMFSLGVILFMYLLMYELTKKEDLSLLTALITAICPLFVFFSHNTQLINPALLFLIITFYYYIKWNKTDNYKYLYLTSIFLIFTVLTKYTFFIVIFPILFTLPYGRLVKAKHFIFNIYILLLIPAWLGYEFLIGKKLGYSATEHSLFSFSEFGKIFTNDFWRIIKIYFIENYTTFGIWLFLIGLLGLFFIKNKLFKKFVFGYIVGTILYFMLVAGKLQGHSYHQYPFAPLIVILISLSIYFMSISWEDITKKKWISLLVKYSIMIIIILLLYFPCMESRNRMFDTQFFGLEVVGYFIHKESNDDDRIFFSGHQSYGVLWHADRKGYDYSIHDIRDVWNAEWVFIYQWGFKLLQDEDQWNYIKDNFRLRQFAYIITDQGAQPYYMVLQRGGSFNESNFNTMLSENIVITKKYELINGEFILNYVNIK